MTIGRTLFASPRGALNDADAAAYLGVEPKTLSNWRAKKTGPYYGKDCNGHIWYYIRALDGWIAAKGTGPAQPDCFPVLRVAASRAAMFLRVNVQVLTNWRRRGKGPAWKCVERKVWYWLPDLIQYALAHRIKPSSAPTPEVVAVKIAPSDDEEAKRYWATVNAQFPREPKPEISRAQR